MRHLGLFEGIGGFSLAAQLMEWETVAWVEKDKFCQKVLKKHFPLAKGYSDIKDFNGKEYEKKIEILTGGFPCQPFSLAGNRKGTSDERYLWDEMFRVISTIKPRWVVAENVPGILSMENGETFEKICLDLESQSYTVQTFIIPSASVGAIHRRDRVWIIANSKSNFNDVAEFKPSVRKKQSEQKLRNSAFKLPKFGRFIKRDFYKSFFYRGNDGFSQRLDRNKALGNAIVPKVAFRIFQIIEKYEKENTSIVGDNLTFPR